MNGGCDLSSDWKIYISCEQPIWNEDVLKGEKEKVVFNLEQCAVVNMVIKM